MAVETLRPSGTGTENNLYIYKEAAPGYDPPDVTNWQYVDEAVADSLTTCLRGDVVGTAWLRDLYAIPNHSVGSGTINSVTIYFNVRGAANITYSRSALLTNATAYNGDIVERAAADTTWYNNSQVYTTNPNTGVEWTWDEVDAMEIGVSGQPSVTNNGPFITQVYVEIDYTAAVAKTSSDTGSSVDALFEAQGIITGSETGSGADAFSDVLATATASETGSGVDTHSTTDILHAGSVSETGSGAETIGNRDTVLTDTGSGVDTPVEVGHTSSDSGVGTDRIRDYVRGFMWRLFNTFTGRTINTHTGLRTYSTHTGRNLST